MTKIHFFGKKAATRALLTEFIYSYIVKSRRSKVYKDAFHRLIWYIRQFEASTGLMLHTDSVTEQVVEEFVYFLKQPEIGKRKRRRKQGLMLNTVSSMVAMLKQMLRKANERGYAVDFGFESVDVGKEDANAVYLTMEELQRINSLSGLSKEQKAVRDRFLLGCFTALRFSDYSTLTSGNVIGDNIVVKTRKTGANVVVPLHPMVNEVLKRNSGEFPPLPSLTAFGHTLRRVCRKAGIVEPVLYERTVGMKVERRRMKKYEMVSSHTARRTGATLMYLAGIPTFNIMLLTGHTTEQSFFKYIRINREENAKMLSEHPFFK